MQSANTYSDSSSRKGFVIILAIILIVFVVLAFVLEKGTFLEGLNQYQNITFDVLFSFFSLFGNGIFIIALSLVLLLVRKFEWKLPAWNVGLYLFSGLLVQIPKRILKLPRPKKFYMEQFDLFDKPVWVDFSTQNSFPSGHTTSAFAMLVFLALLANRAGWRYVFLTGAVLAGISRVYLLQHFLMDVSAGAVVGSSCAVLAWWLYAKYVLS